MQIATVSSSNNKDTSTISLHNINSQHSSSCSIHNKVSRCNNNSCHSKDLVFNILQMHHHLQIAMEAHLSDNLGAQRSERVERIN